MPETMKLAIQTVISALFLTNRNPVSFQLKTLKQFMKTICKNQITHESSVSLFISFFGRQESGYFLFIQEQKEILI